MISNVWLTDMGLNSAHHGPAASKQATAQSKKMDPSGAKDAKAPPQEKPASEAEVAIANAQEKQLAENDGRRGRAMLMAQVARADAREYVNAAKPVTVTNVIPGSAADELDILNKTFPSANELALYMVKNQRYSGHKEVFSSLHLDALNRDKSENVAMVIIRSFDVQVAHTSETKSNNRVTNSEDIPDKTLPSNKLAQSENLAQVVRADSGEDVNSAKPVTVTSVGDQYPGNELDILNKIFPTFNELALYIAKHQTYSGREAMHFQLTLQALNKDTSDEAAMIIIRSFDVQASHVPETKAGNETNASRIIREDGHDVEIAHTSEAKADNNLPVAEEPQAVTIR